MNSKMLKIVIKLFAHKLAKKYNNMIKFLIILKHNYAIPVSEVDVTSLL